MSDPQTLPGQIDAKDKDQNGILPEDTKRDSILQAKEAEGEDAVGELPATPKAKRSVALNDIRGRERKESTTEQPRRSTVLLGDDSGRFTHNEDRLREMSAIFTAPMTKLTVKEVVSMFYYLLLTAAIPTMIGIATAFILGNAFVDGGLTALHYTKTMEALDPNYSLVKSATLDGEPIMTANGFIEGMHSVGAVGLVQTEPDRPSGLGVIFAVMLFGRMMACLLAPVAYIVAYTPKSPFKLMSSLAWTLWKESFKYVGLPLILVVSTSTIMLRALPVFWETTFFPLDKEDIDSIELIFLFLRAFEQSFILVAGMVCYIGFVRILQTPWVFSSVVITCLTFTGFSAFYTFVVVPIFRLLESDMERVLFRVFAWPVVQELIVGIPRVVARRVPNEVVPKESQALVFQAVIILVGFSGRFLLANISSSEWVIIANVSLVVVEVIYRTTAGYRDRLYLGRRRSVDVDTVFSPDLAGTYKCYLLLAEFVMDVTCIPAACSLVSIINVTPDRNKPPVDINVIVLNGCLQFVGEITVLLLLIAITGIGQKLVRAWQQRNELTYIYFSMLSIVMPFAQLNACGLFCFTLSETSRLSTIYCP